MAALEEDGLVAVESAGWIDWLIAASRLRWESQESVDVGESVGSAYVVGTAVHFAGSAVAVAAEENCADDQLDCRSYLLLIPGQGVLHLAALAVEVDLWETPL